MFNLGDLKIALVHDELTRRGGAEIVLEELVRIFPQADVIALYSGEPCMVVDGKKININTSFLQKFPEWWRRRPARLLPLLPYAAEQFDLANYDLVITSSSGFAKAVVTRVGVPHICYCHTTTRYLWDTTHEILNQSSRLRKLVGGLLFHYLRLVDFAAAQRVDYFIANSRYTKQRIATYYNREAKIVYPPIDNIFFTPGKNNMTIKQSEKYFLCVGRLTPMKYFDQAIRVCTKLDLSLVVIGRGTQEARLNKMAGKKVKLIRQVSPKELREYYRGARALLQPGVEDFGMASAESMSCGTPVVAIGQGGANEIIKDGYSGILYKNKSDEGLADAIRRFIGAEYRFSKGVIQAESRGYAREEWRKNIENVILDAIKKK